MTSDSDEFGADDEEPEGKIIPFSRMRADERVSDAWRRERDTTNAKEGKSYRYIGPLEALDELIRKRSLPILPWPNAWPELGKRAVLYQGEVIGISGPTGGGKTSFAIQMALACIGAAVPVLWLPLELDPPEVDLRIVANMARTHTRAVREWQRPEIERMLIAIADRWRYIDKVRDVPGQLDAIATAVKIAKRIYHRPPFVVLDHLGKLARGAKDPRLALADAIAWLTDFAVAEECYMGLLSQTSRGNSAMVTGKIDIESATEAIGVSAETGQLEHDAAVNIALNVFKADDAEILEAHVLVTKARGTGREGREGFSFSKPGGVWSELDYLPATPGEVTTEVKRTTKKGDPVPDSKTTRGDLALKRTTEAARAREVAVLAALGRAGFRGMTTRELRFVPGSGRAQRLAESLADLVRENRIEKLGDGRWRIIT